jgi:hypothetical protein
MSRRSGFENSLLDRVGRSTTSLTVDDIAAVIGDALKNQRQQILGHVRRMIQLESMNNSAKPDDTRVRNLHARLTAVESEIRSLKKGGSR